jgi:parallel beta-helix repeat protein
MHHPFAEHRVGLRRLSHHAHGLILALLAGLALGAAPAAAQPACGDVLTQDTTLTADLYCGAAENDAPLTIGADGITLDLGGHTLSGVENYRIVNEGHDNVTIRNGTILSDGGTIHLSGVSGNVVRDVYNGGLILGIQVDDSHNNRFVHNRIHSVYFTMDRSDHNVIAHNLVTQFESGVFLDDSDYNRIVDNIVWGGREGTSLGLSGDHNEVRRNTFLNQGLAVVSLYGANDTDFVDNTIGPSGSFIKTIGAQIENSSRNRFVGNTVFGIVDGFDLRSGAGNVFRTNDVSGVPVDRPPYIPYVRDGFAIAAGVTGTILRDNDVHGFDDDGIDVDAPGTRLRDNSATDNGDLGIEAVPGVIDQGGNTASGNANPLQCTNVFCG